jgi:hypothetical protein
MMTDIRVKEVRTHLLFEMLDIKSLAALSGANKQLSAEAKSKIDHRYRDYVNSDIPIVELKRTDPQAQIFRDLINSRTYRIKDPTGQVPSFILSDVAGTSDHYNAYKLCPEGSSLPTREQLEALAKAMGKGTPRGYTPDVIPGMNDRWFWSSSVHPNNSDSAFSFSGPFGNVEVGYGRHVDFSVLCAR